MDQNTNENFFEHKPGVGVFVFFVSHCFRLNVEYFLGSVWLRWRTFWDIFCTASEISQNGGLEDCNEMNHQGGTSVSLMQVSPCVCAAAGCSIISSGCEKGHKISHFN